MVGVENNGVTASKVHHGQRAGCGVCWWWPSFGDLGGMSFAGRVWRAIRPQGEAAWYGAGAACLTGVSAALATTTTALADDQLHPPHYPWDHSGPLDAFDMGSVRRGFQVYKQVCSACHSLNRVAFRNLVGNTHTEDEAKALAEDVEIEDGPDENGDMFMRPGTARGVLRRIWRPPSV